VAQIPNIRILRVDYYFKCDSCHDTVLGKDDNLNHIMFPGKIITLCEVCRDYLKNLL
jgi:hypothetical protein